MAVKWAVDIWSLDTVLVKNCPFQSLLSTYSMCFRKCKLHSLEPYRQNTDSAVGATCSVSTGRVFSRGFSNSLSRQGGTENMLNTYLSNSLKCLLFSERRSLSEQLWQQISPTTQNQGVGTTSSCKTHLWLFPTPARNLFAIRPCPWIDSEQVCISLSLSASRKVDACLPKEHLNVNLKWLREYLLVSCTGKGEGWLLFHCEIRIISVNEKCWKYAFLLLHGWSCVALLMYTGSVAPLSLG